MINMEACGSGHLWARKLRTMDHTVKIMIPQFVKPYVKSNKPKSMPCLWRSNSRARSDIRPKASDANRIDTR